MFDDNNNNNNSVPLTSEIENKNESNILLKITSTIILVLSFTLIPIYFIYRSKDELDFLVVSDVHEDNDNLNKLVKKLSNRKFDYVLFLGDFLDPIDNEEEQYEKKQGDEKEDIKKVEKIIKKLEEIAPVLYVGGNHDPLSIFTDDFKIDTDLDKTKNLHKKYQKIKDDLYIVGIGGSTPILNGINYTKDEEPFKSLNISNVLYNGSPYEGNFTEADEQFNDNLTEILDQMEEINASIILMSHIGPIYSYTSIQKLNDSYPMIYLGSLNLFNKYIEEEKIFLNVHGHTHPSRGRYNHYEHKTILNPGALAFSYYATMRIYKKDGKYDIKTTFENLD